MNKIYKVVWNKARHCYMVGSEFISSHSTGSMSKRGSKSLAAALAVCAVCSMGNVFAADALSGKETQNNQYVAYKSEDLGPFHPTGYHYEKYGENGYYVRDGYTLTIDENGGQYTPLCNEKDTKAPITTRADVTWIGSGDKSKDILESSSSIISASGTVTNLGESLHEITPGSFVGVSNSGGTVVPGTFDYIINDSSWAGHVGKYKDRITYQDGWANVIASDTKDNNMPKGFMTIDNSNGRFEWDNKRKTYTYDGKAVDYSNVYVIGGKIGVFTNYGGTEVYKGTVYGRNNEILKTAKSKKDGNLYSFWAAAVTDPSATMDSYRIETYKTDLAILHRDDVSLHNADIKEVQMTTTNDSATFTMVHNGTDEDGNNIPVDGAAITIANGGGTEGKDTWISVGNTDTNAKTFNTGSKVEAITTGTTTNDTTTQDITGITINGQDYRIKSGSKVEVSQDDTQKTTTIIVDGTPTTITDTDTTYTAGTNVEIDEDNNNKINVAGDLTGITSIANGTTTKITLNDKNGTTISGGLSVNNKKITNVADGVADTDAVNLGQLNNVEAKADKHTTLADGINTKVEKVTTNDGHNEYKVNVNLDGYAKADDVAVVFDANTRSLKSTDGAHIGSETKNVTSGIALGKNAGVYNENGNKARNILFGNQSHTSGIAIGENSYALNDSVNIGIKNYTGKIGNVEGLGKTYNITNASGVGVTNIGSNSYSSGTLSTMIGSYSIMTTDYLNGGNSLHAFQNWGAVSVGSLNSIESYGSHAIQSGIANSIVGVANRTQNSNGSLIFGTGNEITNSIGNISTGSARSSVTAMQKNLMDSAAKGNGGGAVLAIGGGNKADYVLHSQMTGVNNSITGTDEKSAEYDMVTGYHNTVNGSSHVTVIGSGNKVTNGENNVVIGDQMTIEGKKDVVSLGNGNTINADNSVALGGGTSVSVNDGVALGAGSVADRKAGSIGYNPSTGNISVLSKDDATEYIWKATKGAVSVGGNGETRQIINVAAGTEDTDAVNVAQLRQVNAKVDNGLKAQTDYSLADGPYTVGKDGTVSLTIKDRNHKDANPLFAKIKGIGVIEAGKSSLVSSNADELGKDIENSVAIGNQAKVTSNNSIAIGNNAKTSDLYAMAIGEKASATSSSSTAIGNGASASGQAAMAIGNKANATGKGSTAIGDKAKADKLDAIAIGNKAEATGTDSIAIGSDTKANNQYSVAIGTDIKSTAESGTAVGHNANASGSNSTAIGTMTNVDIDWNSKHPGEWRVAGDWSTAIGAYAGSWGEQSTSLGYGAEVTADLGVALGAQSIANRDGGKIGAFAPENTTSLTWKANAGAISVGSDTITRQITNVAAGKEDTDAVNVAQLNQVNDKVNKGWNLTTNSSKAAKVDPGATVDFSGDENITISNDGTNVNVALNKALNLTKATFGTGTYIDEDGLVIGRGTSGLEFSKKRVSVGGQQIHDVKAGTDDMDAVNVSQLKSYVTANDTHIKAGDYEVVKKVTESTGKISQDVSMDIVDGSGKTTGTVTIKDVAKASDVGDVSKIDENIRNKEGDTTVVEAVNNLNKNVGDLNYSNVAKGDIEDGDNTTTAIGKLNQKLSDVETKAGAHTTVTAGDNITITEGTNTNGGKKYNVALAKDITVDSVTAGDTKMTTDGVTVGTDISLKKDGLTAGDTKVTNSGLAIGEKTYVSKDGLNANSQKVTNVAAGEVSANSTDAVNGSQLYATNQAVINNAENISTLNRSLSNLDNRVNKVGAGAAALAALHPLDFDPDAKWDFAAGYGNYRGTNAAAVGAYYRPNEDTMFSVGGTFGNGENMVNAGVSFKIGAGSSHVSTSRVAMAKEIKELRSELEAMKSAMLDANAGKKMDTSKLQLFPDVPQNHWAYEYVAQLAGNGMIEGYPDGNFAGDRPMTRYEFAAVLYRAMTKGAVLSDKILNEFSHELEYFTVDTIAKDKDGNPTIQRVRAVKG